MSQPISIDILSDDEEPQNDAVSTPFPRQSKRQKKDALSNPEDDNGEPHDAVSTPVRPHSMRQWTEPLSTHTILVIDDDPTPRKPEGSTSAQSFVAETPMADFPNSGVTIVKCSSKSSSDPQKFSGELGPRKPEGSTSAQSFVAETPMADFPNSSVTIVKCSSKSSSDPQKFSGICGLICLESDNDSESGSGNGKWRQTNTPGIAYDAIKDSKLRQRLVGSEFFHEECLLAGDNVSRMSRNISSPLISSEDDINQANDTPAEEIDKLEPNEDILKLKSRSKINANKGKDADEGNKRRRKTKEERVQLKEEKNQLREMEKLQKAAMKAEAAELKKLEKEKQKWEKGKFALKSIVAEVDTKVVELGSVGGHLLTRFAEKGVTYRITSNPIERSIVWNMAVPNQISQLSSSNTLDIPYVLVLVEAEEFCNLVNNETLMGHVSYVRSHYPSHTICYLTNRLMAYIHKREQEQYKNPATCTSWRRPPVEEVLSKLTTHFVRVHSRQCIDEAELAEHVVGLSCSLASCQFRKKLTRLSVNANGALIPKDCVDKDLFKKNLWLKALIAIPKVQPRFAIAIWKKYPTMRSLLSVYIDPNKSVHEKEFLLKDLTTEGLLCDDRRLGEVCSKRVYRILTAQCGISKTDDVEDGADFFSRKSN